MCSLPDKCGGSSVLLWRNCIRSNTFCWLPDGGASIYLPSLYLGALPCLDGLSAVGSGVSFPHVWFTSNWCAPLMLVVLPLSIHSGYCHALITSLPVPYLFEHLFIYALDPVFREIASCR